MPGCDACPCGGPSAASQDNLGPKMESLLEFRTKINGKELSTVQLLVVYSVQACIYVQHKSFTYTEGAGTVAKVQCKG